MAEGPVLVVGAGPAGLMAAEAAALAGARVQVAHSLPYPGRKFLVAGKGGLNLTHSEPLERFVGRFRGGEERWPGLLRDFGPSQVRTWCAGLGIETWVGSSGRVFPVGDRAGALLAAWLERLRHAGVEFRAHHRLVGLGTGEGGLGIRFAAPEGESSVRPAAVVLALGGGSWPETGSDAGWIPVFEAVGVAVTPLAASNCGYEVSWPPEFLAAFEGQAMKSVAVGFEGRWVRGDPIVTRYGIEGGAIYALSGALRDRTPCEILVDLKPDLPVDRLVERLAGFRGKGSLARRAGIAWKLGPPARGLLAWAATVRGGGDDRQALAVLAKAVPLRLEGPRPMAEAISTAGGVAWSEVDPDLMVRRLPGLFLAGEMLDWDAPTGGYLLTGCLATGFRAGRAAAAWADR